MMDREPTEAEKLFWDKMWKDAQEHMKTTSTKIKAIVDPRLAKIEHNTEEAVSFLSAWFSGLGQAVGERKKARKK